MSLGSAWWIAMVFTLACAHGGCDRSEAGAPVAAPALDLAHALRWVGRADTRDSKRIGFSWSGAGFEAQFEGTGFDVTLTNDDAGFLFNLVIDGQQTNFVASAAHASGYTLAAKLPQGRHSLVLTRETEGQMGTSWLSDVRVHEGHLLPPQPPTLPLIEFIGDSYTCGYGVLGANANCPFSYATESFTRAYAGVTGRALGAEIVGIAASGRGVYRNYDGLADDLVPALYDRAVSNEAQPRWSFERHPAVIVVNLGSNDFGAASDDPSLAVQDAYAEFVAHLRELHPDAWIVCVAGPTIGLDSEVMRGRLQASVGHVVRVRHALGDTRVRSVTFPMFEISALGCDYHPNAEAHAVMGAVLSDVVRPLLTM